MKKGRSHIFTTGVCDILDSNRDKRFCFFELDEVGNRDHFIRVLKAYSDMYLDVLVHRTGRGWHFLSPTVVTLQKWQEFHSRLKDLNKKCPMTTLRTEANKYPDEHTVWGIAMAEFYGDDANKNSYTMARYLNETFGCNFKGDLAGNIKVVRYPLPLLGWMM